jgi:hypothetical protein
METEWQMDGRTESALIVPVGKTGRGLTKGSIQSSTTCLVYLICWVLFEC